MVSFNEYRPASQVCLYRFTKELKGRDIACKCNSWGFVYFHVKSCAISLYRFINEAYTR